MILLKNTLENHINGNKTISKQLIKQYQNNTKTLGIDIVECCCWFGLTETITILKKLDVSDTNIINAFYDYQSEKLNDVKTILFNL